MIQRFTNIGMEQYVYIYLKKWQFLILNIGIVCHSVFFDTYNSIKIKAKIFEETL